MNHQTSIEAGAYPTAVLPREAFKLALERIKLVVEKRHTIPILSNARLSADAGALVVTATDLDMEMRVRIDGEVDGRVDTTLPAELLHSMSVKAPKSDRVTISLLPAQPKRRPVIVDDQHQRDADGELMYELVPTNTYSSDVSQLQFGKVDYKVNAIDPDDFPSLGDFAGKTVRFDLPGSVLWNAIDSVRAAMSTEEARFYLNGVLLERIPYGEPTLRAVATDGHRLYVQQMQAPKGSEDLPQCILPRKLTTVLHTLFKGKACPRQVALRVGTTKEGLRLFRVSFGGVTITSKLIDGTFPDYQRVVPTGNDKIAVIDAAAIRSAIGAVTVISSERGRAVKLCFEKDHLLLSVNNPEAGSARAEVPSEHDFDPIEIGFNADYLASVIDDACPSPGDDVVIKLADAGSPTIISGSLHGWYGVLMPMRV